MDPTNLEVFRGAVHELFIRWESLKLAVEHMGGKHGQQTAAEIRDYIFNYCTQNDGVDEREMADILNEILNEEFDTICEDSSVEALSGHLIANLKLCAAGEVEQVQKHLTALPQCIDWLNPSFKLTLAPRDDSSSDDDDDDDDSDQGMDVDGDDEAPALVNAKQPQKQRPHTDEDGWTTIPKRK